VYGLFDKVSDELCAAAGANYGKRQQVWECTIRPEGGEPCCARRTLTFSKPTAVPPNSNLTTHVKEAAAEVTGRVGRLFVRTLYCRDQN